MLQGLSLFLFLSFAVGLFSLRSPKLVEIWVHVGTLTAQIRAAKVCIVIIITGTIYTNPGSCFCAFLVVEPAAGEGAGAGDGREKLIPDCRHGNLVNNVIYPLAVVSGYPCRHLRLLRLQLWL